MVSEAPYVHRYVEQQLEAALAAFPIVLLDGPRAVGKTTTAKRFVNSELFFPYDLAQIEVDPERYLKSLPYPVLIDEWQLGGTELLWVLKRIVDNDLKPGRFLLTGSVEPATYGQTYPLTGRAVSLPMRPMSQAEIGGRATQPTWLQHRINQLDAASESASPVEAPTAPNGPTRQPADFDIGQIFRSGFPAARQLADSKLYLDGYARTVAQRGGEEGRDSFRLHKAMVVLATLESQAVPAQTIWQSADVDKRTWKHYEDLLARAHIDTPVPAYSTNRLKRLTSYPKRFLCDTALSLALVGVTHEELLSDPKLAGRYFESFALAQLRPQVDQLNAAIWHIRTASQQQEVDALVEVGSSRFAFEFKLGKSPTVSDAKHLIWLRDELGENFTEGYVVHTGPACFALSEKIWALPISHLT